MNATELLAMYERVADAPDAVGKLRRFVLDLAVRGKLVEQDASEEPAVEFLKRVRKEKQALGLPRSPTRTDDDEPLPDGWVITTIGDFAIDVYTGPFGSMLHQSDYVSAGVPLVNPSHMKDDRIVEDTNISVSTSTAKRLSAYALQSGDIVMARRGEVGRAALVEPHQAGWICGTGSFFLRLSAEVNRLYFLLQLRSSELRAYLAGKAVGTTMVNLNHGILRSARLHIPPLAEQHRIVAKVDELMALCDQLEAARTEREAARDRLAAASLARLNAPDPDTFHADARFAINVMPAFTARPDQVKQLRQTILNLAVRGKLVEQDPGEEPASLLLARISSQRESTRGPKSGGRSTSKPAPSLREDPPNIPDSWAWARFAQVASVKSDLVNPRGFQAAPHIAPDNIEAGTGRLLPYESIGMSGVFSAKHRFFAGSLLYSKIRPALRKVVLIDFDGLCSADMYPIQSFIASKYLLLFMLAPVFVEQAVSEANRVAMPKINQEALAEVLVAVPPLAEQHRIVAKVEELMALCDKLEASLTNSDTTRSRLLDALLHAALQPLADVAA